MWMDKTVVFFFQQKVFGSYLCVFSALSSGAMINYVSCCLNWRFYWANISVINKFLGGCVFVWSNCTLGTLETDVWFYTRLTTRFILGWRFCDDKVRTEVRGSCQYVTDNKPKFP